MRTEKIDEFYDDEFYDDGFNNVRRFVTLSILALVTFSLFLILNQQREIKSQKEQWVILEIDNKVFVTSEYQAKNLFVSETDLSFSKNSRLQLICGNSVYVFPLNISYRYRKINENIENVDVLKTVEKYL